MACTAFGAWGPATSTGKLIQNRALDFGGGPFGNYSIVTVYRGSDLERSFMSLSFPGFVGVITGISQNGIGISEKVCFFYHFLCISLDLSIYLFDSLLTPI